MVNLKGFTIKKRKEIIRMEEEKQEKQVWTIDELVAMTETVQNAEIEYAGKVLPVQWCELTESEEPKMAVPDEDTPAEDVSEYYKALAQERVGKMLAKGNKLNPESITITEDSWVKLPTTIRWAISAKILSGDTAQDFITG
tara:strand:- start:194 stop:616 length:423 start_codon:yes stop_codon:yes gene_type:complete